MPLLLSPFQNVGVNDQFLNQTYSTADLAEFRRLAEMASMNMIMMKAATGY